MVFWLYVGASIVFILVLLGILATWYKKVEKQGEVLIINGKTKVTATFTGGVVFPIINTYEYMDITRKGISVERRGQKEGHSDEYEGLHCKDNIRADLKVDFFIGVNPEETDILNVVKTFTAKQASDEVYLKKYFTPKFSEALKTAVKQFEFEELLTKRQEFREEVKKVIKDDLDGFKLYDVVIDRIDQTALEAHDANNILDVEGIEKIAKRTSIKNIETNIIRQDEETSIKKKRVEAEEARLQLDKKEAEAIAKKEREVSVIRAQEEALSQEKAQEYRLQQEKARIKTDEELEIEEENKNREVEIARINNERVTEIEQEKVNRAKETEKVETDREVSVRNMEKEKVLEVQKKEVAETRSVRVQIERKIAKEEEETENLRTRELANRKKLIEVTAAESVAESKQIERVKEAEAQRKAAELQGETVTIQAEADYKKSVKEAEAKERLAEATEKSAAAEGLAEAKVQIHMAEAIKQKGLAEAESVEALGLAQAKGEEARYAAMAQIDAESREHDKYKLELENNKEISIAHINTNAKIAEENAKVLAAAMSKADMKIFGNGDIFNQVRNAMVSGQAFDERFNNSEVLNSLVKDYRSGEKSLSSDLKDVLQSSDVSTGDVGSLMLAQAVAKLASNPKNADLLNTLLNNSPKE